MEADAITLVLSQVGDPVTGTSVDTIVGGPGTGTVIPATVSGSTNGSSIALTLMNTVVLPGGPSVITFSGTFTSATAVSGAFSTGARSESIQLTKQ